MLSTVQVLAIPYAARSAILAWFDASGREFPFRGVADPYAVLVSETMAQQTQIARASAKWGSFLGRFPTIDALAVAAPADVLREWRGLGYNRRALNLQRAARQIVAEHGSRVPSELSALERLPGIGPYTARAVAALAFGQPVGPVDTNVRRVLGRLVGGTKPPAARELQDVADRAVPADRPADWTHAVMDLGATICLSARPRCGACPAQRWCRFAADRHATSPARAVRRSRQPAFAQTTRWLRGRVMDALRDASGQEWVEVAGSIGIHGEDVVAQVLHDLAREGLVELRQAQPLQARLPTV
jgi:A/G-specific adenine glycosylase